MRQALLFVTFLAIANLSLSQIVVSQDVPEGERAIDLMWECQGRGTNYDIAVQSKLSNPDFFGGYDLMVCAQYISGISDLNALFVGVFGTSLFCLPKIGLAREQLIRIFLKWAEEHPSRLHESRRSAVVSAFAEAFPCDK